MKNKISHLGFIFILLLFLPGFFCKPLLSQITSDNSFVLSILNERETIWVNKEEFQKFREEEASTMPKSLDNLTEPSLNIVNFDDMPWNGSAFPISSNRYPGVSFYAPYSNSNTFVIGNYNSSVSFPNRLIVGSVNSAGAVITQSPLVIDFSQPMKNVSLYLNVGGCQIAYVDIYQNNAFSQRIAVT